MNLLLDELPETVRIADQDIPIRTNFRISIMFELMMLDTEISENDKLVLALDLYFPEAYEEVLNNPEEAINQLIWFYKCGKEDNAYAQKLAEKKAERNERIYSFEYDDALIFSAFMEIYGIDLNSIKDLHWWKFRAMFNALSECDFTRIMGYRAKDITNDMSASEKAYYRKMKKLYALPQSKDEAEKQNAIEQALMHGGDISGLLN